MTLFQIGLGTPASGLVQILLCMGLFLFLKRRERKLRPACRWEWLPTAQAGSRRAGQGGENGLRRALGAQQRMLRFVDVFQIVGIRIADHVEWVR